MSFFSKIIVTFVIAILPFCLLPTSSYANPGRGYVEQVAPLDTPTENFPGYFDSNVLPKHRVSLSLPLLNLSFGITENFTISTNVPLLFYMTEQWSPAFLGMARYRFFSNPFLSSSLSGYGGYFSYKDKADSLKLYLLNATYNNSITLTKSQYIITQISALKAEYKRDSLDSSSYDERSVNAITLGIGHNYIFNPRWSIENVFALPIYMNINTKDITADQSISFKRIENYPLFFQSFVSWKISQDSLLKFGAYALFQTEIKFIVLPWINWTVIF